MNERAPLDQKPRLAHVEALWPVVDVIYRRDPTGHDRRHIYRATHFAQEIMRGENRGDPAVILPALQIHDLHQVYQWKNQRHCEPEETLDEAREILRAVDTPPEYIDGILACIRFHNVPDLSQTPAASSPWHAEIQTVQDADCIDQSILRSLAWWNAYGIRFYEPDALSHTGSYEPDESATTLGYLHNIVFPLEKTVHTQTGRALFQQSLRTIAQWTNHTTEALVDAHLPHPRSPHVYHTIFQRSHSSSL